MCLSKRSPYGFGWGCAQCHLPAEGAIVVLCDECLDAEAPIREVIKGPAEQGERLPYEEIANWEDFEHDLSQHPEECNDSDDWDPVVMTDPETGEAIRDSELSAIVERVQQQHRQGQLPPYWKHETSGQLQPAIEAFVNHCAYPDEVSPPTKQQLGLIIQYFKLYIQAPCWQGPDIAELRGSANGLQTVEDCRHWLAKCLREGIDPL
jgi:hypothetical protein